MRDVEVVDVTGKVLESKPPTGSSLEPPAANGAQAMNQQSLKVVARRKHPTYAAREDQLRINLLALDGGRPYVDERLSRFAGESAIDWEGGARADGTPVTGRLEQAHCIPYPGRIADKISQYVFSQPVAREGADAEFTSDVTRDGESVEQFMRRVNDQVTACRWCWVAVDAPQFDAETTTVLQREANKLRPYWTLYDATQVVDWKIAADGTIEWLIVEDTVYSTSDPYTEGEEQKVRDLWEPGKRTRFYFKGSRVVRKEEFTFKLNKVPFLLVGFTSPKPILFDSIESINRTIMDLESCSRQNFFERVFPQMYLPTGAVAAASRVWQVTESQAAEMIVGMSYPILVDKDDAMPGYVQPNAADLATIDTKVSQLKESMFECVGLMLRQESRAAQSGEAKAWDHLDAEAVLADRARQLEEVERKLAVLTNEWDSAIPAWDPQYSRSFDVADFAAGIQAVVQGAQVPQPAELARLGLKVLFQMYRKLNRMELSEEEIAEITEAIAAFERGNGGGAMEPVGGSPEPFMKPGEKKEEPAPDDEEDDEEETSTEEEEE